jgi:exodeoxyribonuclease VII small subunit
VPENNAQPLSFEDALERLEAIVDSMESGEVPLADLLARYEDGTKLLQLCETRLKEAEMKIELLKKQGASAAFAPFPEASPAPTGR